jgi:alpha-tubulin suppressor-like RCC1 family protein
MTTVHTWGRAKNFRLGRDAGGRDARSPEPVPAFGAGGVAAAACGGGHTAVVGADGALRVFGYSQYGQLGLGDRTDVCAATRVFVGDDRDGEGAGKVVGVCCGRYHTMAVTEDGRVYTWGGGKNGRLGHGDEKIRLVPRRVEALRGQRAVAIAAGYHNNLVLTAAGDVWSWGWGAHGQLGTGDARDREAPVVIEDLSGLRVVWLACGDRHSFAVTADGRVFAWGSNEFGQLGVAARGATLLAPECVIALNGLVVVGLSSGDRHSAAVTNVGAVYTWGCGVDGQCGHGDFRDVPRPRVVAALAGITVASVHCGHNFTIAVSDTGEVYAWGNNTYGQLGNGGSGKSAVPVRIPPPDGGRVALVACAHFHCIMVTEPKQAAAVGKDGVSGNVAAAVEDGQDELEDGEGKGKASRYEEIAAADERLRRSLALHAERTAQCSASAKSQCHELVLADILRLSTSPAATSPSSSTSSAFSS